VNERVLLSAYGSDVRLSPQRRTEECVCGGTITAEVGWEAAAVDEHNATPLHQAWRRWRDEQELEER
jgi:hypothetical protein